MRTHHLCVGALLIAGGCAHHERVAEHSAPQHAHLAHTQENGLTAAQAAPIDERVEVPNARRDPALASSGDALPADHGVIAADNTDINERDRGHSTLTPMDQSESESDRALVQRIRKAVIADDSLSFTAKNVKIITRDGQVTLRGPVSNAREKNSIEQVAREAAGPKRVTNELEVAN